MKKDKHMHALDSIPMSQVSFPSRLAVYIANYSVEYLFPDKKTTSSVFSFSSQFLKFLYLQNFPVKNGFPYFELIPQFFYFAIHVFFTISVIGDSIDSDDYIDVGDDIDYG
jgi:hypothetical protein